MHTRCSFQFEANDLMTSHTNTGKAYVRPTVLHHSEPSENLLRQILFTFGQEWSFLCINCQLHTTE